MYRLVRLERKTFETPSNLRTKAEALLDIPSPKGLIGRAGLSL
jgi:hypothetical protein